MKNEIYRKGGYIYQINHEEKTVSAPSSVKEEDYPLEIKSAIKELKYFRQLTIE